MKRAAIIITDADTLSVYRASEELPWWHPEEPEHYDPSERLLADLREAASACALVAATASGPRAQYWDDLAARVRALLPEEDEDE